MCENPLDVLDSSALESTQAKSHLFLQISLGLCITHLLKNLSIYPYNFIGFEKNIAWKPLILRALKAPMLKTTYLISLSSKGFQIIIKLLEQIKGNLPKKGGKD